MEAPRCRHCRQRRGAAGIACRCRPRTVPAGTTDLRISAAGIPARPGEQRACRTAGAGGVSASTPARAYLVIETSSGPRAVAEDGDHPTRGCRVPAALTGDATTREPRPITPVARWSLTASRPHATDCSCTQRPCAGLRRTLRERVGGRKKKSPADKGWALQMVEVGGTQKYFFQSIEMQGKNCVSASSKRYLKRYPTIIR